MLSTVGQFRRADRQGIRIEVGAGAFDQPGHHFSRHVIEHRERDHDLIELFGFGELVDGGVVEFLQFHHQFHELFGHAKIPPRGRTFAHDVLDHPPDFFLERRRRKGQQPVANGVLGPAQQVMQEFHGKIEAKAEDLDQLVVGFGVGDHAGIAGFGKPRGRVFRQPADDPGFAALDDHVGDRFGQIVPRRDREQMILSLDAGDLDQRFGAEAVGVGQHVAGDRNLVVPCQILDDFERRVIERRQPLAQLGPGPRFDARDQEAQHVVEDLDLVVAETLSIIEEEIGDLTQGFDPPG